jgi:hypothetical protein
VEISVFSVWLVAEESVVFELGVCAFGRRGETLVSIKLAHLDNKFNGALILFLNKFNFNIQQYPQSIKLAHHFNIRFIFHYKMFFKLFYPSNNPIYLYMFLFALAIAYVTRALSTNLRSFLSAFSDLAASKYD